MMKPVLDIKLFRKDARGKCPPWERQRSQHALLWMMEGGCRVNQDQIRLRRPPVPPLYSSGIRYQREDGTEEWQDCYTTIEKGWGDCEDLAMYRVAELREVYHRKARCFLTFKMTVDEDGAEAFHYHALLWGQGPRGWRLEDPSRKLGMGWEEYFADTTQAYRNRAERIMDRVQRDVSPRRLARLKKVA